MTLRPTTEAAGAGLLLGVGANNFAESSGHLEWLRLSGVRAVRLFAGVPRLPPASKEDDAVRGGRAFARRRAALRKSEAQLNASAAIFASSNEGVLRAAERNGLAVLLVLQVRPSVLPIASGGGQRWRDAWDLWRTLYAGVRHYVRAHPRVARWLWQIFNEPDHPSGTTADDFVARLRLGADAIGSALRDAGVSTPRALLAPALCHHGVDEGRGGWQRGGFAQKVLAAHHAKHPLHGRGALVDSWSYHTYNSGGGAVHRAARTVRASLNASGAEAMPLYITEFNAWSHREFKRRADTMDSPAAFARLGAQLAAAFAAGVDGAFVFRLTQTALPQRDGGGVKKNGLLRLRPPSPRTADVVVGATRAFHVLKFFSACADGAPLLDARDGSALNRWVIACRRSAGGFAVLLVHACEDDPRQRRCGARSHEVALDVSAWGVRDGAAALLAEVSALAAGNVDQVLAVRGGVVRWAQPEDSVQLLTLSAAPVASELRAAGGGTCAADGAPPPAPPPLRCERGGAPAPIGRFDAHRTDVGAPLALLAFDGVVFGRGAASLLVYGTLPCDGACEEDTDAAGERWLLGELRADLRGTSAAPARHQIDAGAWLREAARRGAADVVVLAACELGPKAKAAEARLDAVTLEVFAPSEGR
jgi:hypothetical protein